MLDLDCSFAQKISTNGLARYTKHTCNWRAVHSDQCSITCIDEVHFVLRFLISCSLVPITFQVKHNSISVVQNHFLIAFWVEYHKTVGVKNFFRSCKSKCLAQFMN